MPLQNRVTPWSAIEASPARGLFVGNRGCLVDDEGRMATLRWRTKAWICCLLEWRGKRRPLNQPRHWTPLFFLDEATALSAGHRPCAYCRRADYNAFLAAWAKAFPRPEVWRAPGMDAQLHGERTDRRPRPTPLAVLPDGALVERKGQGGQAWLKAGGRLWRWSHQGYCDGEPLAPGEIVNPVTPPSMLAVLANGSPPLLHPSISAS